jgi:hypothetical protein
LESGHRNPEKIPQEHPKKLTRANTEPEKKKTLQAQPSEENER